MSHIYDDTQDSVVSFDPPPPFRLPLRYGPDEIFIRESNTVKCLKFCVNPQTLSLIARNTVHGGGMAEMLS